MVATLVNGFGVGIVSINTSNVTTDVAFIAKLATSMPVVVGFPVTATPSTFDELATKDNPVVSASVITILVAGFTPVFFKVTV